MVLADYTNSCVGIDTQYSRTYSSMDEYVTLELAQWRENQLVGSLHTGRIERYIKK